DLAFLVKVEPLGELGGTDAAVTVLVEGFQGGLQGRALLQLRGVEDPVAILFGSRHGLLCRLLRRGVLRIPPPAPRRRTPGRAAQGRQEEHPPHEPAARGGPRARDDARGAWVLSRE